jgi:hypothetical protein
MKTALRTEPALFENCEIEASVVGEKLFPGKVIGPVSFGWANPDPSDQDSHGGM